MLHAIRGGVVDLPSFVVAAILTVTLVRKGATIVLHYQAARAGTYTVVRRVFCRIKLGLLL